MARLHPMLVTQSIILSVVLVSSSALTPEKEHFARNLDPKVLGLHKQKLTHFRVYWHDMVRGSKPTSVQIVAPRTNATKFGLVHMIDDPLTQGPELNSTLLGKAQGFYASASQQEFCLLMAMNLAFTSGKYKGSSIAVLGRNPIFEPVREMPVIGGSGRFRFARGFAQLTTYFSNTTSLYAIVQYNIYVLHY